jgi:hypothetical protein
MTQASTKTQGPGKQVHVNREIGESQAMTEERHQQQTKGVCLNPPMYGRPDSPDLKEKKMMMDPWMSELRDNLGANMQCFVEQANYSDQRRGWKKYNRNCI